MDLKAYGTLFVGLRLKSTERNGTDTELFCFSGLLEFEPAGDSLRSPGGNPRNFEGDCGGA